MEGIDLTADMELVRNKIYMKLLFFLLLLIIPNINISAQNLITNRDATILNIGDTLQNIELTDCNGNHLRLNDYCGKGNYTVVDFGATWCIPSRKDTPLLKQYYEKYHQNGLNMVSIYAETNINAWKRHVESVGVLWPLMSELTKSAYESKGLKTYGVKYIPLYIILDKEGHVIFMSCGSLSFGQEHKDVLGPKLYELYGY